jgi:hypothetical protein
MGVVDSQLVGTLLPLPLRRREERWASGFLMEMLAPPCHSPTGAGGAMLLIGWDVAIHDCTSIC